MKVWKFDQKISQYWLMIWAAIYILIVFIGVAFPSSDTLTIVKLLSVLLCSFYSIVAFRKDHLLHLAMIITFVADCLLAGDNISMIGLMVFFMAQCVHLYRLLDPIKRKFAPYLLITGYLIVAVDLLLNIIPPIYVICTFYAITLLLNLLISRQRYKLHPQSLYAFCGFWGFILFACCDLCTGISYFSLIELFPAFLYMPANVIAWVFYYPSQVLLSHSTTVQRNNVSK